jgi:hypothetical protein
VGNAHTRSFNQAKRQLGVARPDPRFERHALETYKTEDEELHVGAAGG